MDVPPGQLAYFFRHNRPPLRFLIDKPASQPSPETPEDGGNAPICGASLARLSTTELGARRRVGETLDKIGNLQNHVKTFA